MEKDGFYCRFRLIHECQFFVVKSNLVVLALRLAQVPAKSIAHLTVRCTIMGSTLSSGSRKNVWSAFFLHQRFSNLVSGSLLLTLYSLSDCVRLQLGNEEAEDDNEWADCRNAWDD